MFLFPRELKGEYGWEHMMCVHDFARWETECGKVNNSIQELQMREMKELISVRG